MAAPETPTTEGFIPSPETQRAFRDALGAFATGVTVVTTSTEAGVVGITANSFASLSMDPPLVLWSPARSSARFSIFSAAEAFSIHVLAQGQEAVARHFTRVHQLPEDGLGDVLARFDCTRYAVHEGGDHVILVGHVQRVWHNPGAPLVFQGGRFGRFADL